MTTAELVPVDSGSEDVHDDVVAAASQPDAAEPDPDAAVAPAAPEASDLSDAPDDRAWEQPLRAAGTRLGLAEARLAELTDLLVANGSGLDAARAEIRSAQAAADAAQSVADTAQTKADALRTAVDVALAGLTTGADVSASIARRVAAVDQRQAKMDARISAVESVLSLEHVVQRLDSSVAELAERAAAHDERLADVQRSIATEVERFTSDALLSSQQSLQLAVNSIAQLALAMAESTRDLSEDVSAESATVLLDSFRIDLDAILAQLGFEPLQTIAGEPFDPHRHRALKRVPTPDPLQDKLITQVIRDGYRNATTGRILLFADVEVGRHRP